MGFLVAFILAIFVYIFVYILYLCIRVAWDTARMESQRSAVRQGSERAGQFSPGRFFSYVEKNVDHFKDVLLRDAPEGEGEPPGLGHHLTQAGLAARAKTSEGTMDSLLTVVYSLEKSYSILRGVEGAEGPKEDFRLFLEQLDQQLDPYIARGHFGNRVGAKTTIESRTWRRRSASTKSARGDVKRRGRRSA